MNTSNYFRKNKKEIIIGSTLGLAICGIISACLAYYLKVGWNPLMFFTWDLPLYAFCIWALYKGVYKTLKKQNII